MQTQALPGFREFFPDDLALRAHIFQVWRRVATRYGFEEYDGPPLEPLDLYTVKSGAEIVGQLYHFVDKGGREVALRPEMTPTLARMVSARAGALKKPIRWFSIPQLFRYERQQRGRLREHFQLNCDLIGEPGPLGDAEVIALAIDVIRELGFTAADVRVRLSDRRVLQALLAAGGVRDEQLEAAYQAIDKSERATRPELVSRLESAGLTAAAIDTVLRTGSIRGRAEILRALEPVPGGMEAGAPLARTIEALDAMGLGEFVEVDLTIVRGLAYYTGTVFELFDAARTLRALCGGGRYDDLLRSLGGADLPALGFGMGDVVLAELIRERGLAPGPVARLDVFVAAVTPEDLSSVLALAHQLRAAGLRTEYALAPMGLGKQLKLADARGSAWAVVIGPDDRARGEVMIKDLRPNGAGQRAVPERAAAAELARMAAEPGPQGGGRGNG